jgi:ABC-type transport system involved in cytochrome c biogenesis permease subunit
VFLTIGLIAGVVFAVQAHVPAMLSLDDPKIFVALICWAVYSFELFAARRIGWAGRRAAYLSALGFAIVLLNFVPISYLTSSHKF